MKWYGFYNMMYIVLTYDFLWLFYSRRDRRNPKLHHIGFNLHKSHRRPLVPIPVNALRSSGWDSALTLWTFKKLILSNPPSQWITTIMIPPSQIRDLSPPPSTFLYSYSSVVLGGSRKLFIYNVVGWFKAFWHSIFCQVRICGHAQDHTQLWIHKGSQCLPL